MKLLGSFRKPEPVRLGSLLILYALIAVFLVGCAMLVAAALGAESFAPEMDIRKREKMPDTNPSQATATSRFKTASVEMPTVFLTVEIPPENVLRRQGFALVRVPDAQWAEVVAAWKIAYPNQREEKPAPTTPIRLEFYRR